VDHLRVLLRLLIRFPPKALVQLRKASCISLRRIENGE